MIYSLPVSQVRIIKLLLTVARLGFLARAIKRTFIFAFYLNSPKVQHWEGIVVGAIRGVLQDRVRDRDVKDVPVNRYKLICFALISRPMPR